MILLAPNCSNSSTLCRLDLAAASTSARREELKGYYEIIMIQNEADRKSAKKIAAKKNICPSFVFQLGSHYVFPYLKAG